MGKLNSLMEGIERVVDEEKWSAKVKTKWSPPEGFFKQDAGKIASGLMSASKDGAQAMERLNFYINRAGDNLSAEDKARLEDAKKKLSAMKEDEDLEEARAVTGYSVRKLFDLLLKASKEGNGKMITMYHDELKAKGADMHAVDLVIRTNKLPGIVKQMKEDVGDIDEAKKVTYAQISKAAKKVTDSAVWDREMAKLGLDPEKWNAGFDAFVLPIIVATVNGQGVDVDNTAMQSAKQMLKTILKSLSSGKDVETEE